MKDQELPQPVSQLLETLENDVARKIAKAKFALDRNISQILTDFGSQIQGSNGELVTTPKVQVLSGDLHYDFWVEERYKQNKPGESGEKVKQTILYALPEDDTEGSEMATIEGETILDICDNELDEVEEIEGLSKVFSFLREELEKAKVHA